MIEFKCPFCSAEIEALSPAKGKVVQCRKCSRAVEVPATATEVAEPPKPVPQLRGLIVSIVLENCENPHWPNLCACCGVPPETLMTVTFKKYEDHTMRTVKHQVPACYACVKHQNAAIGAGDWVTIALLAGFLLTELVLYSMFQRSERVLQYMMLTMVGWAVMALVIISKVKKANEAAAEALTSERCTGGKFIKFERKFSGAFQQKFEDTYQFSNREYARQFLLCNERSQTRT